MPRRTKLGKLGMKIGSESEPSAAVKCFEDKGLGENYILATTCGKDKNLLEVVISAMFYRGCL